MPDDANRDRPVIECKREGCSDPSLTRGMCRKHYRTALATGEIARLTQESRFFARVVAAPGGCWQWVGALNPAGYGASNLKDCASLAHRYSYELAKGKIPDFMHLDHLCRNRACVNPDHLEPVTNQENVNRGLASRDLVDRCGYGHDRAEHSYWAPGRRAWECRACAHNRYLRRKKST